MAPLNGVAAVQFLGQLANGQQCSNTVHIWNSGIGHAPTPADLTQLATDIDAYFATTYRALLNTAATYVSVKISQVPDPAIPGDAYADYILPKNLAGTRATTNEALPNQACMCVSLKTTSGQRSYRGHLLLPPGIEAREMGGQNWNTGNAYYVAGAAFAAKLQDGCYGSHTWTGTALSAYELAIYSKKLQLASLPSVNPVITVVPSAVVHWLRSRARGTT